MFPFVLPGEQGRQSSEGNVLGRARRVVKRKDTALPGGAAVFQESFLDGVTQRLGVEEEEENLARKISGERAPGQQDKQVQRPRGRREQAARNRGHGDGAQGVRGETV